MAEQRIYYSEEAEAKAKRQTTMMAAGVLLLGLVLGGIAALLFAPQKGEKTRSNIADELESGIDQSRDSTQKALERLEREYHSLRKEVEKMLSSVR